MKTNFKERRKTERNFLMQEENRFSPGAAELDIERHVISTNRKYNCGTILRLYAPFIEFERTELPETAPGNKVKKIPTLLDHANNYNQPKDAPCDDFRKIIAPERPNHGKE